jgi:hypothetical protein
MSVYYLKESKVNIRVIDQDDPELNLKSSMWLKPSSIKAFVGAFDSCDLCVTATMPDVYMYIKVGESYSRTYHLAYRCFLAFVAELEAPGERELDWRICGF